MDGGNKVSVRIYGQEYVISGNESREHIMKVADFVNSKMHEVGSGMNASFTSIAVLSAINIADEYITNMDGDVAAREENRKLKEDKEHYIQLWEEAKKSFSQYQEDAKEEQRKNAELRDEMDKLRSEQQDALAEKEASVKILFDEKMKEMKQDFAEKEKSLKQSFADKEADYRDKLTSKSKEIEELKNAAKKQSAVRGQAGEPLDTAEREKLKELESACFELEMENVKLKAEVDRLKKQL